MTKPWLRWCSLDFWLNPSARIEIQNMSIVEVNIALLLSSIVVASEVEDRCSNQSSRVATPGTWWNSLNLWECPEPRSLT